MASSTFKVGDRVKVKRITPRNDFDSSLPCGGVIKQVDAGGYFIRTDVVFDNAPDYLWYCTAHELGKLDGLLDI